MNHASDSTALFEKYEAFALASLVATVPDDGVADGKPIVWSAIALLVAGTVGDLHAVATVPLRGDEPPVAPLLKNGAAGDEDEPTLRGELFRAAIRKLGEALALSEQARVSSEIRKEGAKGEVASAIMDAAGWATSAAGLLNRTVSERRPATWMIATAEYAERGEDRPLAPKFQAAALERYRLATAIFKHMPASDEIRLGARYASESRAETRAMQIKMSLAAPNGTSLRRDAENLLAIDRLYDVARVEGPSEENLAPIVEAQSALKGRLKKLGLE